MMRVHVYIDTSVEYPEGDKSREMQREEQTTVERQNVDVDERADCIVYSRETLSGHAYVSASPRVMQIYPFPLSRFSMEYRDIARLFPLLFISSFPPFSSRFIMERPMKEATLPRFCRHRSLSVRYYNEL